MYWYTTVIKTRILRNENHVPLGHTRNVGRKDWYATFYETCEEKNFSTLQLAKDWLEKCANTR